MLDALSITIWLIIQPRAPLSVLIDEGTDSTKPGPPSQTDMKGSIRGMCWIDSVENWMGFVLIVDLVSLLVPKPRQVVCTFLTRGIFPAQQSKGNLVGYAFQFSCS